jgi:protein-disulfide isomerase
MSLSRRRRLLAAAILPLALASVGLAAGGEPDKAFGDKVRAYLLAHPEVLMEVSAKLQEKEAAATQAKAQGAIAAHRQAIERDPRDFVANPGGSVTVTEFFDYRCGYCKLAAPEVLKLIAANPDVRFVFKEFVIFGRESEDAARLVMGAQAQGKTLDLHRRLMAEKSVDDPAILRIAREAGVDIAKAEAAGGSAAVTQQLQDIHTLATTLAIQGTPAFIVGDTMIAGADLPALKRAIDEAKAGKLKKV